ncbi:pyridoxal phosphate-dependent aminotransferase [Sulfurospirillum barnesii]|uniref:Aspartate/tyrosine/aromatic aminotransferase n=1 Tax=Sulfurospirillum barnesii (strain ATCC 700032 / DSM 10660 / SES-3) TaxID=760154 RepID=I3XXD1_SULBS|nr:pyridoxal phosphate-dependent aminotransferase [Sulfurospirillum barnesii]AFL68605.1 aspartate/tyrosine/aromatic aminotransferase [Sulfurospirillum barnesii SES-3]
MLSQRIQVLSPSLTLAITALARDLKAQGKDILSFSAGEPDFDTPQGVKDAAIEAIQHGCSKYTAVAGTPEVLKAIAGKLKRENNLDYKPSQIVVNVGAKHSLFNIFQAIIDEGDEVIIPAPYWVTYPEIVKYSGGTPVYIETDESSDFKITPAQLKAAITPKTKVLLFNTPSNPTGAVYSKSDLEAIAEVLKGTNVLVVSDEMYEKILFDNLTFTSVASISEDMFHRTITVNGLSKSVAMPGWRFGYLACPIKEIVDAIVDLQGQSTSNINTITQKAAIPALNGDVDVDIETMRAAFERRRNMAYDLLNNIKGLSVMKPEGAFYLYVNTKAVENDSMKFCSKLLEETGVAVVPGLGFGSDGYFRFSFATDDATIKDGIGRIKAFVENYK